MKKAIIMLLMLYPITSNCSQAADDLFASQAGDDASYYATVEQYKNAYYDLEKHLSDLSVHNWTEHKYREIRMMDFVFMCPEVLPK